MPQKHYFPYHVEILGARYQIIGKIRSTLGDGHHFETHGVINNDGNVFLALLDNHERHGISNLSTEENQFADRFAAIDNCLLTCYRKID